ncbi:MutT/nudix family protein [Haladaptatus paucihalophilus DX253]|uniref:MutT/nudix family protein n=1 Tax=Haladaptatus paucihalophilus DX253 TaxID=797209 RepID=E7QYT3_HALPU|nr:NUDIX domain-containing protein [Haladaptatus paucihalophilus]EFW90349.1 MutT/nudix family protein [Haladaptatus paucihalophilus DX253]SHK01896.1 NUDIX domain-containing protein [Haladaptatus paucihalophilus DX253]
MTDRPVTEDKAYAYITRSGAQFRQLLVFEHANEDAGVQVPKGTIEDGEDPREAVVREVREESGLTEFDSIRPLSTDVWNHHEKPKAYRRHFFHLVANVERDEWRHTVTGSGEDNGVVYSYFWVPPGACSLARDMDDYIERILD